VRVARHPATRSNERVRYLTDAEAWVLRAKVGEQQSPKIAVALHPVTRRGHLFALR